MKNLVDINNNKREMHLIFIWICGCVSKGASVTPDAKRDCIFRIEDVVTI